MCAYVAKEGLHDRVSSFRNAYRLKRVGHSSNIGSFLQPNVSFYLECLLFNKRYFSQVIFPEMVRRVRANSIVWSGVTRILLLLS